MEIEEAEELARKNSFYISVLYVGIGTVALFASTSSAMKNEILSIIILLVDVVTIPVCFIGFGILYGGGKGAGMFAFIVQIGVFLLFWYIMYRYLLKRYKKR
ncbi:MAG TPA: hypothetical protein VIN08_19955 [Ohtaekwangia sp.]|uniref:hypothetical protein n=1 Tax=Ohtaekwangia sp. TaxID=2066019 RepID=UPI002F9306C2